MITAEELQKDIPLDLARQAHAGTSFDPNKRAQQEREGYAATLIQDLENLSKLADTDEKRSVLEEEFTRYRNSFLTHYVVMLEAKSCCLSTMIAGPSKFNSYKAQKASDRADARTKDMLEYRGRALAAIRKKLTPELQPIMSGDSDATERLADKIAKLEKKQEEMRAVNLAIRKHVKGGHSAQIAALVALGYSEGRAADFLKPDFAGRTGYASYELTNNNANIKRLKARAVVVERNQSTADAVQQGEHARMEDAPAENRVRLFFPGKPSVEIRTKLKSCGFRWSPTTGAWQAYRNQNSMAVAAQVAGVAS